MNRVSHTRDMRSNRFAPLLICTAFFLFFGIDAKAFTYDMYRNDYAKGAFCTAIAGACAADIDPANSYFQNPASLEMGEPGLNFDGDYKPADNIEPGMKTSNQVTENTFMGGVGYAGDQFGWAFSISGRTNNVKSNASFLNELDQVRTLASEDSNLTLLFNIPVAYRINSDLSVGASLNGIYYSEKITVEGAKVSATSAVNKFPSFSLRFGSIYRLSPYFRIGGWLRTPMTFSVVQDLNYSTSTFSVNSSERVDLHYPFMSSIGLSFMPFADKRTILFDLEFVGTTLYGFERTLDTFDSASNTSVKRAKGHKMVIQPHLAWRSPWTEGSLGTYYLGTHYESSRWEGLSGRIHGVTGVSYVVKSLDIETILAIDLASDFVSLQVSFR